MTNPRLEDHLVGLELQLVELVENKQRAEVQGREEDATVLAAEIAALQLELATTAEQIADAEEAADEADRPTVFAPTAARAA
ncbi:MAG: hypothetical protein ACLGI2_15035 [Acidimicrobiia bacterium]